MDGSALLLNLATALIAATIGAATAVRLGQSAILGYIVAGIAIGPHTPGFVGDVEIVRDLADIGVVFLMFAIGARIAIRDLLRVGAVAAVGGTAQVLLLIGIGYGVGRAMGWGELESVFFGAVVSNSSSTVLGKVLGERGEADTEHGHIALAWSTVQDLGTIVLVVLLSALAGGGAEGLPLAIGKALLFLGLLVPAGLWIVPRAFEFLASFRSREIFIVGVVGLALGTAFLASQFGISLALGAFLAGLLVGESDLGYQVLGEAVPFRDLFAGIFFVSVGMLVDPGFVASNAPLALVVLFVIVPLKGVVTATLTALFRYRARTALMTGALLAQSAEFSFLLARLGTDLGVVGTTAFSLMLSGAAASVVLASPIARAVGPLAGRIERRFASRADATAAPFEPIVPADGRRYVVICGYGRVGRLVAATLARRGFRHLVIEDDPRAAAELRLHAIPVVRGSADNPVVLEQARLDRAAALVVAVADPVAARLIVRAAREMQPRLPIVARTHSAAERLALRHLGADEVVVGEVELGLEMTRFTLRRLGVSAAEANAIVAGLRGR